MEENNNPNNATSLASLHNNVLPLILGYLPLEDVYSVALVSKLWAKICRYEGFSGSSPRSGLDISYQICGGRPHPCLNLK